MGIYQSRTRGLWVKGETSGATQELLRIDLDCDRDSPRFVVRQQPAPASATSTPAPAGARTRASATSRARSPSVASTAPPGSYTAKLFADPDLLGAKLREEADELAEARGPRRT